MNGRILAVDPGEKRLGLALSDPTASFAKPLKVLKHVARAEDAAAIIALAVEHECISLVIGQALDDEGNPTPQSRHAERLAEAIRERTGLPVILWDESGSTQAARAARIAMNVSRRKRRGHLDEAAAAVILQDYLDALARDPKDG